MHHTIAAPQISAAGVMTKPYLAPDGQSSNLVDKGSAQGLPAFAYDGSAPDIGAYEYGAITAARTGRENRGRSIIYYIYACIFMHVHKYNK